MTNLALILAVALSSGQVAGVCGSGRVCNGTEFRTVSNAANVRQQCWSNNTTAVQLTRNSQFLYFGAATSCVSTPSSNPLYFDTTSLATGVGTGYSFRIDGTSSPTSLATPSYVTRGFSSDSATGRIWKADGVEWTEVGDNHKDTRWRTYVIESDRTAGANAPVWNPGPRAGGATPAFTSAGTLSNRTGVYSEALTTYATTAVSGNQAHHSTTAFFAPGSYVSFRAGASTGLTSQRLFYGMSSALPLTSGSSTPTAHAAVFRFDTAAGDTAWQACTGAGVAITCTTTGVTVTNPADIDTTLEIDCREASALGFPTACVFWVNGIARVRLTSNLPAASLGSTASIETLTAASRDLKFGARTIEVK